MSSFCSSFLIFLGPFYITTESIEWVFNADKYLSVLIKEANVVTWIENDLSFMLHYDFSLLSNDRQADRIFTASWGDI